MGGCCKLSLYADGSCDEHAVFSAMIEMTCHINHFFDLWQWCNFSGIVKRPLNFRVFIHEYVFPVVANVRTKSIQKQIKSINVGWVGSKNLQRVNAVSCRINRLLFVDLISKQARLNATLKALLFFNYAADFLALCTSYIEWIVAQNSG